MRTLLKSMLVCILALFGVIFITPMTTEAAEAIINVYDEEDLKDILYNETGVAEATYVVQNDFEADYGVIVQSGRNVVLDLNGHSITGIRSAFRNEGTFTIRDSKGGGMISMSTEYKKMSMFRNEGTLYLEGGKLCFETNLNDSNVDADSNIVMIDNVGTLVMSGGELDGTFNLKASSIDCVIIGIKSGAYSELQITGGKLSVHTKTDVFTNSQRSYMELYGIYILSNSPTSISNFTYQSVNECAPTPSDNILFSFGIEKGGPDDFSLNNSNIKIDLKGTASKLRGMICGIENLEGGSTWIDRTKFNITAPESIKSDSMVGVFNLHGNLYIGHSSASNKENMIVNVDGPTSNTFGIAHLADILEDSKMILERGYVKAKSAVLNEGFGLLQVGVDDGVINNNDIHVVGTENAFLCAEDDFTNTPFKVHVYDGLIEGKYDKTRTILPAGFGLKNIATNTYVVVDGAELIAAFVTRLYNVCLNREPDAGGKASWTNNLKKGYVSGIQAAKGFIFSQEFKNKNYCNEDYVKQLYRAFMGREADAGGLTGWVKNLNSGMTREAVFNGFALSKEFRNICADYAIKVGSAIAVPKYGTIPTGSCSACGVEDGVTQFVKRLYRICLDREADAGGLASWSKQLWNHTSSGRKVAQGFIFSQEFKNKNYSNEVFVEYLYQAFMGRPSDAGGKAGWVKNLERGMTRKQVFDGFAGSKEFTNICNQYGILRD